MRIFPIKCKPWAFIAIVAVLALFCVGSLLTVAKFPFGAGVITALAGVAIWLEVWEMRCKDKEPEVMHVVPQPGEENNGQ